MLKNFFNFEVKYLVISLTLVSMLTIDCKKKDDSSSKNLSIFALLAISTQRVGVTPIGNDGAIPTIAVAGSPFSFFNSVAITNITPNITGNPTACTSSPSLPSGLSIDAITCVISGTPTTNQAATTYTLTVTNAVGSANANISIAISTQVAPTISFAASNPFRLNPSTAVSSTPTLSGSPPTSCTSAPALPAGLVLDQTTCSITGTPTVTQDSVAHLITATNGAGSGSFQINLEVTKRIFVTASSFMGNMGGISGADALCQADANKPATGTYKAMLVDSGPITRRACFSNNCSTANEDINWVFTANTPYNRAGSPFRVGTTNARKIFVFSINNAVSTLNVTPHTGMSSGWVTDTIDSCTSWTSSSAGINSRRGSANTSTNSLLDNLAPGACNVAAPLYCVEQ